MIPHLSVGELLVLLVVVLLILGPRRLPELAGSIGKSLKAFKDGIRDSDASPPPNPDKTP